MKYIIEFLTALLLFGATIKGCESKPEQVEKFYYHRVDSIGIIDIFYYQSAYD